MSCQLRASLLLLLLLLLYFQVEKSSPCSFVAFTLSRKAFLIDFCLSQYNVKMQLYRNVESYLEIKEKQKNMFTK